MEYTVAYAVPNRFCSPLPEAASLDGEIGTRFDRFVYERITGKFAIDEKRRHIGICNIIHFALGIYLFESVTVNLYQIFLSRKEVIAPLLTARFTAGVPAAGIIYTSGIDGVHHK